MEREGGYEATRTRTLAVENAMVGRQDLRRRGANRGGRQGHARAHQQERLDGRGADGKLCPSYRSSSVTA